MEAEKIKEAFHNFFAKLFTTATPSSHDIRLSTSGIQQKFDASMNIKLLKQFTKEEVEHALYQMAPLKSLGPNGFGAVFFQKH